jgi:hypothetical protein
MPNSTLNDPVDDSQHSDRECRWLRYAIRVDLNGGVGGQCCVTRHAVADEGVQSDRAVA